MGNEYVQALITETTRLYEESRHPFPHAGCKTVLGQEGERYKFFVPDLDFYLTRIALCCGMGKDILKSSKEKLIEAREKLEQSFFEQYPEYGPLEPRITESDTPDLYADMQLHEKMRATLLTLFSLLLSEGYPLPILKGDKADGP